MEGDSERPPQLRYPRPLLLFDGVCNLCNATVQWVIERDKRNRFYFASLQSEAARKQLAGAAPELDPDTLPDSIVLIDQDGVHTRSDAALRIGRQLGFPYTLIGVGIVVPRAIRNAAYGFIARNRYRWFGRRDTCMMPTPDVSSRFLDADEPRPPVADVD